VQLGVVRLRDELVHHARHNPRSSCWSYMANEVMCNSRHSGQPHGQKCNSARARRGQDRPFFTALIPLYHYQPYSTAAYLDGFRCRAQYIRWSKVLSLFEKVSQDEFRVKIGAQAHHSTSISTSNESVIVVRGRNLTDELIGRINFTDHFWLLLTGDLPSAAQRTILDATLVAIAEHGLVPSVQASRMTLAASPEALQGAVAAGILGCGSVVLGSSEAAGAFLPKSPRVRPPGNVESAADAVIQRVPGGRTRHPRLRPSLHKDYYPRALRLFEIAAGALDRNTHVEIARTVARICRGFSVSSWPSTCPARFLQYCSMPAIRSAR